MDGFPDLITSSFTLDSWPHVFINDGAGTLGAPITDGDPSFWFDPVAAALVGNDDTVAEYEVSVEFNQNIDAALGDLDGDGRLDYYFSQSESNNNLPDHFMKADEDRIYLGRSDCQ